MTEHQVSIYFIRHAQSKFNAVFDALKPDPMIFDAELSELGHHQATRTGEAISKLNITKIIVSPFTRTLQTASLIFGDRRLFQINAMVREQLSNSCDIGTHPEKLGEIYSHLDFSHLDDCWWHQGEPDHRGFATESHEVLLERVGKFITCLQEDRSLLHDNHESASDDQSERSIAIVSHGNFIKAATGVQPDNCEIVRFNPFNREAQSINIGL